MIEKLSIKDAEKRLSSKQRKRAGNKQSTRQFFFKTDKLATFLFFSLSLATV